jgi:hypothetical protein
MERRKTVDRHPGPMPDIRTQDDGVVFDFDLASGERGARLIIRCDAEGNAWARITRRGDDRA